MERLGPRVNDPSSYYAGDPSPSLGWELTICQCLSSPDSPYLGAMTRPRLYGEVVAEYLAEHAGLAPESTLLEVGGGYGSLMAALLAAVAVRRVTMVDVSPFFLEHQKRALAGRAGCSFACSDALAFFGPDGDAVDVVISNENLGDLPTGVDLETERIARLASAGEGAVTTPAPVELRSARLVARYGLELPDSPRFHLNVGAMEYLERLRPRARAVFLTEHGAEDRVPPAYAGFLSELPCTGWPRPIRLRGHEEYSIRFDHLEAVARGLGYRVRRFHLFELLGLRQDETARSMARAPNTLSERAEAVSELYHHAGEYQGMLLTA